MKDYKDETIDLYREAAETPNVGLCCTTNPVWQLPGLTIPQIMLEMNYGCGSTVDPADLAFDPTVLYIGVGGGMELLQFAYFTRAKSKVIGVDIVDEMLEASRENFKKAEEMNPWFKSDFVDLVKGDALDLPLEDESVDVVAQNCVFNIFKDQDLITALKEAYRVLKPHGRLVMSDPVSESHMPEHLKDDGQLRALCLSGALPLDDYIKVLTDIGFGTIEVRAKRPYRILSPGHYDVKENIIIESVEICAIKDPVLDDGPCVFTGKAAIYYGKEDEYDDGKGHVMLQNQPLAICDKTARQIADLNHPEIYVSESTYHYSGGGCC